MHNMHTTVCILRLEYAYYTCTTRESSYSRVVVLLLASTRSTRSTTSYCSSSNKKYAHTHNTTRVLAFSIISIVRSYGYYELVL